MSFALTPCFYTQKNKWTQHYPELESKIYLLRKGNLFSPVCLFAHFVLYMLLFSTVNLTTLTLDKYTNILLVNESLIPLQISPEPLNLLLQSSQSGFCGRKYKHSW